MEAQPAEHFSGKFRTHHRLSSNMRRHEQSLEKRAIAGSIGTHFSSQSGRSQLLCTAVHQIRPAADISAGRRHAAAGIFNQRTGRDIRTELDRLFPAGKFSIAVIHETDRFRILFLHGGNNLPDVFRKQCFPVHIPA